MHQNFEQKCVGKHAHTSTSTFSIFLLPVAFYMLLFASTIA